jgi:RNA polymerase sigma factor (sigma-70 family)
MMQSVRDDPEVTDLVVRARQSDKAAWDAIVARYAPLVWSVCRRYGLARADIEDVGSSVWLRLVENLERLREPAALPGWLVTTTRRECQQFLTAGKRQFPVESVDLPPDPSPGSEEMVLAEERRAALRQAFAGLQERCRQLLSMLFGDPPSSYAEISSTLGLAVGAIGPNRARCLDRLRREPALLSLRDTAPDAPESGA